MQAYHSEPTPQRQILQPRHQTAQTVSAETASSGRRVPAPLGNHGISGADA